MLNQPPKNDDCDHVKIDVSPHYAFRTSVLACRCTACGRFWELTGTVFKEIKSDQRTGEISEDGSHVVTPCCKIRYPASSCSMLLTCACAAGTNLGDLWNKLHAQPTT